MTQFLDYMPNLELSYTSVLSGFISILHRNETRINPRYINRAKFYARAFFVVYQYAISHNSIDIPSVRTVSALMAKHFSRKNLFSQIIDNAPSELIDYFDSIEKTKSDLSIGELYESLLSIETSGFEVKEGKVYRNKLGSYYTPADYASYIASSVLENYISRNGEESISSARIVDYSCGCGIFFTELLSAIKSKGIIKDIAAIVKNIYACDVDPLALEVAKLSVLEYGECHKLYDIISEHFHHANMLIHSDKEASPEVKLNASLDGFIYHPSLAVGTSFLQQYDIILGNPPWEKLRFEEKKFYAQFSESIQSVHFKFELPGNIQQEKEENPELKTYAEEYVKGIETAKTEIKKSTFFDASKIGELNTCPLFAEASYNTLSKNGCCGLFVKSSLFTASVNSKLFHRIVTRTEAIYDFINKRKIFEIDCRERFAILIMGKQVEGRIALGMNLLALDEIAIKTEIIPLSVFKKLNPATGLIPNLRSSKDLSLLTSICNRISVFSKGYAEAKFGRLVHLTNHVEFIDKAPSVNNIPVFEGKFFNLFDNCYSGFNDMSPEEMYKSKASSRKLSQQEKDAGITPYCRFYISKRKWESLSKEYDSRYMLAWHSLTSADNARSCIATLLPFIPGAQSVQFLTLPDQNDLVFLTGIFSSIVFDYLVKCKLSGIDLTQAVINQIPVPSIEVSNSSTLTLGGRTESYYNSVYTIVSELFKKDQSLRGIWDRRCIVPLLTNGLSENRLLLEALVAKLYKIGEEEFKYIISCFGVYYEPSEQNKILSYFKEIH